jgi:hypothetical protein
MVLVEVSIALLSPEQKKIACKCNKAKQFQIEQK